MGGRTLLFEVSPRQSVIPDPTHDPTVETVRIWDSTGGPPAGLSAAMLRVPDANYAEPRAGQPISLAAANLTGTLRLWPGLAPGDRSGTVGPEVEYCLTSGVPVPECKDLGFTNVTVPTITPFLVPGADSAVVVAPGGAYKGLSFTREGTDIAAWLNSIGVSAFVLKYRVPGPTRSWLPFGAAPLMDAQRAMGLVRRMAGVSLPALNKSKVGFIGFSAGAHLTGHLNVAWGARAYPRVDAADDEPCRPDFAAMVYPWRSVSQQPVSEPPSGASADNVTSSTPPTMLVQAEDDRYMAVT